MRLRHGLRLENAVRLFASEAVLRPGVVIDIFGFDGETISARVLHSERNCVEDDEKRDEVVEVRVVRQLPKWILKRVVWGLNSLFSALVSVLAHFLEIITLCVLFILLLAKLFLEGVGDNREGQVHAEKGAQQDHENVVQRGHRPSK